MYDWRALWTQKASSKYTGQKKQENIWQTFHNLLENWVAVILLQCAENNLLFGQGF